MKKQWISILIVGMAFGTAWAIRGQFGHEPGAAWAGGIGALALILVAQRQDWYAKVLPVALASMIGWGGTGMISYGIVVGYGRSSDFINASYGFLMLFVIGGLFGLLGGGLTALALDSSKKKPVSWSTLMTEMTAGGLIAYYLLVEQLGFLMTPPRSEAWAICLGAGLSMLWYMVRNKHTPPLRVAFYTAMGAGFGFAFGNFLQILGEILAIKFNMWNVMEYSIGFFGGTSLAYSVYSSEWTEETAAPKRWENKIAYFTVFLLVPYLVFSNSDLIQVFLSKAAVPNLQGEGGFYGSMIAALLIIGVALAGWFKACNSEKSIERKDVLTLLLLFLGTYIFISYGVTGAFNGIFLSNHQLYVLNFVVILLLVRKQSNAFWQYPISNNDYQRWVRYSLAICGVLILLAFIIIHLHGDFAGAHNRF